jgi:hypothetical protein
MRELGGPIIISHVLAIMAIGRFLTVSNLLRYGRRSIVEAGVKRFAAGGKGDKARRLTEILLVVAL